MGWRDTIKARPASFRGVPFFVGTSDRSGGRRDVKHEYPQRDLPFFEDLGKATTGFSITGHVLGDDYLAKRDALISVLEDDATIGTLQHPYYGQLRVKARAFSVTESTREGGIANFSMDFEQAEAPRDVTVENVADEISTSSNSVDVAIEETLSNDFSVEDMPGFFVDQAEGWVNDLSTLFSDSLQFIATEDSDEQEVSELQTRIDDLETNNNALVEDPDTLATEITGIFADVQAVSESSGDLYKFSKAVSTYGDDYADLPLTTPTRILQAANRKALLDAARAAAVANQARNAGKKEYESQSEAAIDRDDMLDQIEDITVDGPNDTIYTTLTLLKPGILKIVTSTQTKVLEIEQPTATPEFALSWRLYEDPTQELTLRNGFYHPGFLSGTLEVLSDA